MNKEEFLRRLQERLKEKGLQGITFEELKRQYDKMKKFYRERLESGLNLQYYLRYVLDIKYADNSFFTEYKDGNEFEKISVKDLKENVLGFTLYMTARYLNWIYAIEGIVDNVEELKKALKKYGPIGEVLGGSLKEFSEDLYLEMWDALNDTVRDRKPVILNNFEAIQKEKTKRSFAETIHEERTEEEHPKKLKNPYGLRNENWTEEESEIAEKIIKSISHKPSSRTRRINHRRKVKRET